MDSIIFNHDKKMNCEQIVVVAMKRNLCISYREMLVHTITTEDVIYDLEVFYNGTLVIQ